MAEVDEMFAELHKELIRELLEKVKAGKASPRELSVARQLLKDNHVTSVPKEGDNMDALADHMEDLPEFDEDGDNVVPMR